MSLDNLTAAVLNPAQQEVVDHFRAANVPADWYVGEPQKDGSVKVVALGEGFVWELDIAADGNFHSHECTLKADGWETGITI